jgi:outer membrane protein TolC
MCALSLSVALSSVASAQDASPLDSLVAQAIDASPIIAAARARADAAAARVGPAGARPDPMLMAGVQNFPLSEPGFADFMTMKMIGVTQTIPWPGKLSGRVSIADEELAGARAAVVGAQRSVAREVRTLYYDLAFTTRALDVVTRTQGVVAAMIPVTETRYASGSGSQSEILRMRVETARLANEAAMLVEERRATLTELNALLERPADTPVGDAAIPIAIARAAIADSARSITFESASLGARVKGSPIPTVDSLLALAVRNGAALKEHEAMMRAQHARVALARRERLPDVDVSLQYGQRSGFADMVTAVVSVPIPLQKHRKQDADVSAAEADLRALEAEHMVALNELRAKLARLDGALERDRTQLALYVRSILPQARASLASASAGYQAGRVEFATLIDAQALLFNYETDYYRTLTDFAKTLAELEEQTGMELIQ